jgi:hopene-associated glycosyltransferase HpnB
LTASFAIAAASLSVWLYLIAARGHFWRAIPREDRETNAEPPLWPKVTIIVPARDEAVLITQSLSSLFDLDYPGVMNVILIDDQSQDGTAALAKSLAVAHNESRLTVMSGRQASAGWSGKLWAMQQGLDAARDPLQSPRYVLFTDADIVLAKDTLKRLVARAESSGLVVVSLMAKLHCKSLAERCLIPAFVFFFQMLYPFQWINRRDRTEAAAAGGCMLVRYDDLRAAGGLAAIRSCLIDDCALAQLLKPLGPIWLGLSRRVHSLRTYPRFDDIGQMVRRSAYEQLGRSPLLLIMTIAGMALTYVAPPVLALAASGLARIIGISVWVVMALAFQPILRFYRLSSLWGVLLPAISSIYMVFTLQSAYQHFRGRGGYWKGRMHAHASESE